MDLTELINDDEFNRRAKEGGYIFCKNFRVLESSIKLEKVNSNDLVKFVNYELSEDELDNFYNLAVKMKIKSNINMALHYDKLLLIDGINKENSRMKYFINDAFSGVESNIKQTVILRVIPYIEWLNDQYMIYFKELYPSNNIFLKLKTTEFEQIDYSLIPEIIIDYTYLENEKKFIFDVEINQRVVANIK